MTVPLLRRPVAPEVIVPVPPPGETCDRCPAPGRVVVQLRSGRLVFCGHHHARYEVALIAAGGRVVA